MLTRSGWGAVVVAIAAFVVGRVFGIIELFVLGAGLVAVLVLAVCLMLRRPPRLAVRRLVQPGVVKAGEPARVDLQVANLGATPTPVIQLWEPVGSTGGATMNLSPLRRRETASAAYRLPTEQRGLIVVGPMRARRRDVLGLCSKSFTVPGSVELLIIPQHVPVAFPVGGSGGRLGDHLRLRAYGQSGSEFHSLREYMVGDDLRRISWKASARATELIVKETALEGLRRCTVVFDVDAAQYDDESFERGVSAAASVVTGAAAAGLTTRLIATDTDLRGHEVAPNALRWLAMVEPVEQMLPALPTLRAGEGMGVVVVVTGAPSSTCAAQVRGSLSPEDTLIVVASAAVGESRDRFVVAAPSLDKFYESWSHLTGALGHRRPVAVSA
jgi:uncharacterized protein (DUF58 family)